ncbi:hypothetical protein M5689_014453 [Euphorbia peplus]|nr:hypothetical protein M5689_014453 [Euphorbia peplus]
MALKWLLSSSFTQVLGSVDTVALQKTSDTIACTNVEGQMLKDGKGGGVIEIIKKEDYPNGFQVPLHYPKYSKADYENMEEWRLDLLLHQYGLCFKGTLVDKKAFAIGAFLWPAQI